MAGTRAKAKPTMTDLECRDPTFSAGRCGVGQACGKPAQTRSTRLSRWMIEDLRAERRLFEGCRIWDTKASRGKEAWGSELYPELTNSENSETLDPDPPRTKKDSWVWEAW